MKNRIPLSLWWLTAITLALLIFQGCDRNGVEKDLGNTSDTGYEGFQSDVELYYEFVYRKESLLLNYLNYITDGFTKELFKGEITYEDYDKFFHELAMLNADSPKYKAAIQRLESSGVLQSPTRTRGLFGTGMFSWMGGSKKRARKRVLTVVSNLTPEERTTLYKDLRPEWKRQSSSEADFWRQLENGSYDNMAAQMHNDFYHNGNTNYEELSHDKGLSIQKIFKAEGAVGVKAGVEDMIDTSAKFIPGIDTGANLAKMTDNVDKINNGKDIYEKATNALELLETIEDMTGGDSGLLDEILDELNPVPTKYDVAQSLATKMDHYLKSDIKPGDKEETFGKVTVIDKNREKPTQYVIVQKKEGTSTDNNSPSIYITGREYMQKGIDLLVKAGNWLVTAIGENGRRETVEVEVKPGKVTTTEVNTAEPEETEDPDESLPDEDVIVLTIAELDGKSEIGFEVEYLPDTKEKLWIDLNGNDKKDKGEEVQYNVRYWLRGIPTAQTVKIHGASFITYIGSSYNEVTSIDVRKCKALKELSIFKLPLTSLMVDGCTALENLSCHYTQITSLNLTGCKALKEIYCYDNKELAELNISECKALKEFTIIMSKLTSLNLSGFTSLEEIRCNANNLTKLNVSGCTALKQLQCQDNQLTSLDVSDCTALKHLQCGNNGLLGIIPPYFKNIETFLHDVRYKYEYDWEQRKYVMIEDTKRGWWYEHEPEGGCHEPEPCNK